MAELAFGEHQPGEERADGHRQTDQRSDPRGADARDRIASGNASRRPLAVTSRSSSGSSSRLTAATAPIASSARPSAGGTADSGVCPDRIGTSSSSTTIARSCSSRMPTVSRPCGADSSFRSASPFRTMAVLDSATNRPMKIASDAEPSLRTRTTAATGRRRADHLQRAGDHDRPPDLPHRRQREIESDREQQEDDAELRQHLDFFGGADHPQPARTRDDAGQHHRDDRGHAHARQRDDEHQRDRVGQDQMGEEVIVHRISSLCTPGHVRPSRTAFMNRSSWLR